MAIGLNNDINNLGILNGNINSDFRNVVQNITNLSTGQNDGTNTKLYNNTQYYQTATTQYRIVCQGTITPKYSSSLIEIIGNLCCHADNTVTTQMEGLLYVHSASQGNIGVNISTPSGTLITKFVSGTSIGTTGAGVGSFALLGFTNILTAGLTYYITLFGRNYNGSTGYINISSTHYSGMIFKEYV